MINDWAEMHPKEVIILALTNFKGFNKNNKSHLHNHLISSIKTIFGAKLVVRKVKLFFFLVISVFLTGHFKIITFQQGVPSLKSCWDQRRNVIVSYDYPTNQHIEMWGKIAYYYGNTMDPVVVQNQLRLKLEKRGKPTGELLVSSLTDLITS